MIGALLSYLWFRLWWKPVYQYHHRDDEETVGLYRHRLTFTTRRIWYGSLYDD